MTELWITFRYMNNKQSYMTKVAWPQILSNHSEPLRTAENLILLFVGRNSRGWFTSCWKRHCTPMFNMVWHEENRSKNAQTAKSCVKNVACQRAVPDYALHISLFTTHFTEMEKIKDCLGQTKCSTTLRYDFAPEWMWISHVGTGANRQKSNEISTS